MTERLRVMVAWAAGVAVVASILVGASVALGFFDSPYEVRSAYNEIHLASASEDDLEEVGASGSELSITRTFVDEVADDELTTDDEALIAETLGAIQEPVEPGGIRAVLADYRPVFMVLVPLVFFGAALVVDHVRR